MSRPRFPSSLLPTALALAAAAAALLTRGFGVAFTCGWLLVGAVSMAGRHQRWRRMALLPLLLPPAGLQGPEAQAAVALAAALVIASDTGLAIRAIALAGGLLPFLSGESSAMTAPLLLLAIVAVVPGRTLRRAALLAGMALIPIFGEIPRPSQPEPSVVGERFVDGDVAWEGPVNLYTGGESLLLRAGRPCTVVLDLEAGGVRDTAAVGMVVTDLMALPVRSGRDTLEVAVEEGWVLVTMERESSAGAHPVVRLHGAWTGGLR